MQCPAEQKQPSSSQGELNGNKQQGEAPVILISGEPEPKAGWPAKMRQNDPRSGVLIPDYFDNERNSSVPVNNDKHIDIFRHNYRPSPRTDSMIVSVGDSSDEDENTG